MARRLFVPVLCLSLCSPLLWGGNSKSFAVEEAATGEPVAESSKKSNDDYYKLFELFVDSLDQIERNYVHEVSRRELMEAAIEGMIDKLDPHSSFVSPDKVDRFRANVENRFGGIGIHVAVEDGRLKVVSPLVGAPAYQAGILADDHIMEIEGNSTKDITLDEAVRQLKGKVGTEVTVKVRNGTDGAPRQITIRRDTVHVETVLGDRRNADDTWSYLIDEDQRIGYIRVNSFGRDTASNLRRVLKQLVAQDLRGLVLDLRFNPGGLLTSAIEVSDMFVSEGRIVSTKGRNTRERTWDAKQKGTFGDFPMIVLINRFSASASEIVSACLQDHERAVIVGERSYGKGSVQNVIELEDGKSVLKLTTASYQRPSGKNIHRFPDAPDSDEWGVRPVDEANRIRLSSVETRELLAHRRQRFIAHGRRPQTSDPDAADDTEAVADDAIEEDAADDSGAEDGEDGAADESKSADEETSEEPAEETGDDKSDGDKSDGDKSDGDKSDGDKSDGDKSNDSKSDNQFVDRQLQRALKCLSGELARAETLETAATAESP